MSESKESEPSDEKDDQSALTAVNEFLKSSEASSRLLSNVAASSDSWPQAVAKNAKALEALNEVVKLNLDWAQLANYKPSWSYTLSQPDLFPRLEKLLPNMPDLSSWRSTIGAATAKQISARLQEVFTTIDGLQRENARSVAKLNTPRFAISTQKFIATTQGLKYDSQRTVWHYTSGTALMHILNQSQLWASSPHHLNDASEVSHGIEVIRRAIGDYERDPSGDEGGASEVWNQVLNQEQIEALMNELYFISASRNDDSLTLWRNYAAGDGFAIGLDAGTELSADGFASNLALGSNRVPRISGWYKVHYMPQKKHELAKEFVKSANLDIMRSHHNDQEQLVKELRKHVLILASTMKHDAFRDEREVRWMTTNWMPIDPVHYEHARTAIVPVLHVRSASPTDDPALLPIRGIRCSPVSGFTITRTIEGLLRQKGYLTAAKSVRRSILPFKG